MLVNSAGRWNYCLADIEISLISLSIRPRASAESLCIVMQKLDLGIDCDSRIALVGPNGAGDSAVLSTFRVIGLLAKCLFACDI